MAQEHGRPRQLVLDLARDPSYDADQFLVSASNAQAHELVESWPPLQGAVVLLTGPPGSGKSHLGSIWAKRAAARIVRPGDGLDIGTWDRPVVALVEDCDRAAYPEPALFHLLNLVKETVGCLVLTARSSPALWPISTPDLLSRLRLARSVAIHQPDNALIRAVIVKLFADRQIRIEEDVVAYAALHCERSLGAIRAFVEAIDEDALATGRRITRPLAVQTMARLTAKGPHDGAGLDESDDRDAYGPT